MTSYDPRSLYEAAMFYAYLIIRNYREASDMFAVNGILFNHESTDKGAGFCDAKNYPGGCENSCRTAGEVRGFVLATVKPATVRFFCGMAFNHLGIELRWKGEGVNEKGIQLMN